ncbi:5-formyltetrahydrofolate cyclo-ligase [Lentimicrobium sp. S6]|uniref:5-formyltetrahydrofolate cyclo-ligase n=1 Tax=Lentimicrobium sp. S6 TaxID=2735872 RepID=UPI0015547203|nr:5-formyltetrahydrofolate cyclo-ligase [Lentimicrobium sp. S6]NPD47561.1 5-formyltetrahydrofolate cyclo-ligase [Lentimicrobium sp. S6]
MDIFQQKKALRRKVKELKSQHTLAQKKELSTPILKKIEESSVFKSSDIIMAYWSMDDEVFTHDFVMKWAEQKRIILPVVNGDELELKEFKGVDKLIAGENFGIPEPNGPIFETPEQIQMIIVPGVAFDKNNNRMGRGKAYYDKLLRASKAYKLGLCFSFQVFEEVPFDDLDVQMDSVVY